MSKLTQPVAHQYDEVFYRYQREGAARSAAAVLPTVLGALEVRSVFDVGCGAGAWLSVYRKLGVSDFLGADGDYVDRSVLMVDPANFRPLDITKPFDLGREFDLVQCLEVAEHVPPARSGQLVDNIVKHGKCVMFSAAVPGQGGEDHINEQSYGYWRDLFGARGYRLFDFVRPEMLAKPEVEFWYRYNLLFFAHDSVIAGLPAAVAATRVGDHDPVPDPSPLTYKVRKLLLRALPESVVSQLAVWKHRRFLRAMRAG
jgi:SAM-dependent methyltransferase